MACRELRREEYTVGWVCALPIELAAAQEMLDEEHERLQDCATIYTLGRIGEYNVVIASLPEGQTGTVSAAVVAQKMIAAFTSIRIGLMVGIGGGVPAEEADIRLGDVVISKPHKVHGGVVQYDFGKATPGGFERTGSLNTPPTILLNAVTNLQANHIRGRYRLPDYLSKLNGLRAFAREGAGPDTLFEAKYNHEGGAKCGNCSKDRLVSREPRVQEVVVHYGTIASGNQVMRDGAERDRVSAELGGVLCFEMEAAGLMNSFPCLVIRGICDYADSHKNKKWQAYAAGTAAACAKEVLSVIPPAEVAKARKAELVIASHEFLPLLYENACIYEDSKTRNRQRVPGTCDWFTNHILFRQWNSPSNSQRPSLLYVTADPGCGKSVLSRFLIDDILPGSGRTVCFFFFKEDFEHQRSSLRALCSLLHQLFVSNRHLLTEDILKRYTDRGKRFFESFDNLWDTFLFAAGHQETVCVLDALDECRDKDRKQLIDAITAICHVRSSKTTEYGGPKFLLTSRPYEHIRAQFFIQLKTSIASIHLQGDQGPTADAIAQEIQLVLNSRINETAEFFCLEPDERALMRLQLGSVPNRTYLWITLVFDGLMDRKLGVSKGDIMSLLREPPQSVYDAYEKILNKSPDLEVARRLLHIIIGAERPLSLAEMSIALAFKDNQSVASVSERIIPYSRIRTYVRDLCGLFAIIVDNKVYLLHQTAREFLVHNNAEAASRELQHNLHKLNRKDSTETYIWQHSIAITDTNTVLVKICISYLLSPIVPHHSSLLKYAAIYWANHYRQSPDSCQVDMANMARDLFLPSDACSQWTRIYNEHTNIPRHESPLCLSSAMGLEKIVKLLLFEQYSTGIDPENKVGSKNSLSRPLSQVKLGQKYHEDLQGALSHAAGNGHEAVVKLLLQSKADVNIKESGRTPLSYAARNGHEAVVKLLLQSKADVNLKDKDGRTPLSYAAGEGHEASVKLLLQSKAEVDLKDEGGRTPLSYAAVNGREAIVKLLLQSKADVNLKDGSDRTPLWYAAVNGREAVVKLLLQSKADVDLKDKDGRTPLSYAARIGHEAVVKLLLQSKADVDLKDKDGRTPLLYTAESGHEAVVKLLLQSKADVNSKDGGDRTPLWCAAVNGREAIVKLLLETGQADVNSEDYTLGQTPLWSAASSGREAIVKLLLETGRADVDWKDRYYGRTPLWCAVNDGYEAVVKLLLKSGQANINAKDKHGRTPLLYAAAKGDETMIKLLLETGRADVESKDKHDRTPLSYAAAKGHEAVVKLLLEIGRADVDAKDEYGRKPLSHAAENGREAVVKLLLGIGQADVNWMDEYYGRTPLSYAAAKGHEAVVKLLLENGRANVDLMDEYCRPPLSYAAASGHEAVVKLLLKTGQANVDLKDIFGRTSLSYAAEKEHEVVVKLLRSAGSP